MNRASAIFAFWALLLVVIFVIGWAIFFPSSAPEAWLFIGLPAFAILTTLAAAALSSVGRGTAAPDPGRPVALDRLSFPAALVGIGIVAIVLGIAVGAWLWMVGVALALAGGFGVMRELRARRRVERAAERAGSTLGG